MNNMFTVSPCMTALANDILNSYKLFQTVNNFQLMLDECIFSFRRIY